jgi:hypothetical protein
MIDLMPDTNDNILPRPVQLRMFTSIMQSIHAEHIELTRYQLYASFIYRFLAREKTKPARRGKHPSEPGEVVSKQRFEFMREIAWWVLTIKKENKFLATDIRHDVIPPQLRSGLSADGAIREALVGSVIEPMSAAGVLESKAKPYYFFHIRAT